MGGIGSGLRQPRPEPLSAAERKAVNRCSRKAVEALRREQMDLIGGLHARGFSQAEIGEMLGYSTNWVSVRFRR